MENEKKKKTIMIIEDEASLLKAIRDKLYRNNFEMIAARTANQALELLKSLEVMKNESYVDAIWLDHYLLGYEDGLDFMKKIKSNEHWKNIPVFVVSNTASESKVESYLKLGITKYYVKADYRLDQIVDDIKKFLDNVK
jgi:DNA-binding response OmpR family regulator